jgi:hypothetical protein
MIDAKFEDVSLAYLDPKGGISELISRTEDVVFIGSLVFGASLE